MRTRHSVCKHGSSRLKVQSSLGSDGCAGKSGIMAGSTAVQTPHPFGNMAAAFQIQDCRTSGGDGCTSDRGIMTGCTTTHV